MTKTTSTSRTPSTGSGAALTGKRATTRATTAHKEQVAKPNPGSVTSLNNLQNRPGSCGSSKRRGRGIGSGLGKTSGRGHKGQKARAGGGKGDFEGGQMPLYRRLPKRGFTSARPRLAAVPVGRLERLKQFVIDGRLSSVETIDTSILRRFGLISRASVGVKLIAGGDLVTAFNLTVQGASESARASVTKAGGSLTVVPRVVKSTPNRRSMDKASATS